MKQLRQCFFVQVGADHAQAAGIVGAAVTDDDFPGNIVKLEPFPGCVLQDSFGAEDPAVFLFIRQLRQDGTDLVLFVALRGFQADVAEDLVRIMLPFAMMMVVMVMMFMFVFVVIVVMVVLMLVLIIVIVVVMVVMMLVLVVIVIIVVMVVAAAFVVIIVIVEVMMMVMVFMLIFVIVVIMVMVAAYRADVLLVHKLFRQISVPLFHRIKDRLSIELIPGRRNYHGFFIMFANKFQRSVKFLLRNVLRAAENYTRSGLDLVVIKFTEILNVDFRFTNVSDNASGIDLHVFALNFRCSTDNVA